MGRHAAVACASRPPIRLPNGLALASCLPRLNPSVPTFIHRTKQCERPLADSQCDPAPDPLATAHQVRAHPARTRRTFRPVNTTRVCKGRSATVTSTAYRNCLPMQMPSFCKPNKNSVCPLERPAGASLRSSKSTANTLTARIGFADSASLLALPKGNSPPSNISGPNTLEARIRPRPRHIRPKRLLPGLAKVQ